VLKFRYDPRHGVHRDGQLLPIKNHMALFAVLNGAFGGACRAAAMHRIDRAELHHRAQWRSCR
jgi:microcystin-dependent protein